MPGAATQQTGPHGAHCTGARALPDPIVHAAGEFLVVVPRVRDLRARPLLLLEAPFFPIKKR